MREKEFMRISIEANGPALHMKGENAEIDMIPFKGKAEIPDPDGGSPLFTGIVEPCGVDTQIVNAAGVRHMSARYMLTGTDRAGREVHIYIENNGWFDDATKTMPFHTVPTIYTDSDELAAILHRNQFTGEGAVEEDGLWIRFYRIG